MKGISAVDDTIDQPEAINIKNVASGYACYLR
jgi:hypothetical protein